MESEKESTKGIEEQLNKTADPIPALKPNRPQAGDPSPKPKREEIDFRPIRRTGSTPSTVRTTPPSNKVPTRQKKKKRSSSSVYLRKLRKKARRFFTNFAGRRKGVKKQTSVKPWTQKATSAKSTGALHSTGLHKLLSFSWLYRIYLSFLAVAAFFILTRVHSSLTELERYDPEKYIQAALASLTEDQVAELYKDVETFDQKDSAYIKNALASDPLDIRKDEDSTYIVLRDGEPCLTADLHAVRTVSLGGLINYSVYDEAKLTPDPDYAFYPLTITAPGGYEVTVNGKQLEPSEEIRIDAFSDGYSYAAIPVTVTYTVEGLMSEPEIEITSAGTPVPFTTASVIDLTPVYPSYELLEDAGLDFDALLFAENWSLFLTDDLEGDDHGLSQIREWLIRGSVQDSKAVAWGTGIDITFTSEHTLSDPIFTNEAVSDVTRYSTDAFSVHVYLDKEMHISNGLDVTDTLDSTLYVVRYDDAWKVINITGN